MEKLRMIKITNEEIKEIEIEDKLENLQKEVEGLIEVVDIYDHICLICNEEGKIMQLPINLGLFRNGELIELIAGNVLICAEDKKGNFKSLTQSEIEMFMNDKRLEIFRALILD